jgi:general secretion pathway protein I
MRLCSCESRNPGSGSTTSAPAFAGARSPDGSLGFTLLEMLVALAIFALAGLALVRLQAVSARSAFDLRERTMAQIVARNLMVERLTDPKAPAFGSETGKAENFGRIWAWRQGTAPLQDKRLIAITIRVEGGPGQSPAILSFVRPAS